jgi:hypothetical protein
MRKVGSKLDFGENMAPHSLGMALGKVIKRMVWYPRQDSNLRHAV